MSKLRILCTGPESSGTKMMAQLIREAGAHVDHSSPNQRRNKHKRFPRSGDEYDAIIIMVRNWFAQNQSAASHKQALNTEHAREMNVYGLSDIFYGLRYGSNLSNTYMVTYESIVHEDRSLEILVNELGLDFDSISSEVIDQNRKYFEVALYGKKLYI